jgi:Wzt C-terminal domain
LSSQWIEITQIKIANAKNEDCRGFFQHDYFGLEIGLTCQKTIKNPAAWIRFTRRDGIVATSWHSHEPKFHDLGVLNSGRHKITISTDDLLLGDGVYEITVALFAEKTGGDSAFYNDPLCMWERMLQIEIKRPTRPLTTLFDQPMKIQHQVQTENRSAA